VVLDLEFVLELELDLELGKNVPDKEVDKEILEALCRRGDGCRLPCRLRGGNVDHVAADPDSDSDSGSGSGSGSEV
jgi:hypothetical protein